jgi:hypothetical protein
VAAQQLPKGELVAGLGRRDQHAQLAPHRLSAGSRGGHQKGMKWSWTRRPLLQRLIPSAPRGVGYLLPERCAAALAPHQQPGGQRAQGHGNQLHRVSSRGSSSP